MEKATLALSIFNAVLNTIFLVVLAVFAVQAFVPNGSLWNYIQIGPKLYDLTKLLTPEALAAANPPRQPHPYR